MFCPNCGVNNEGGAKFCAHCGQAMPGSAGGPAAAPSQTMLQSAPPPTPQQIIIKERRSPVNAILTLFLVLIILCVGTLYAADYAGATSRGFAELISNPDQLIAEIEQIGRTLINEFTAAEDPTDGDGMNEPEADDCPEIEDAFPLYLANEGFYLDPVGIDFESAEYRDADYTYLAVHQNGQYGDPHSCSYNPSYNGTLLCPTVEEEEFPYNSRGFDLEYESLSCKGSYANRPGGQTAGDAAIADICAETFYQPPEFTVVNWDNDTLSVDVFAPVLSAWPNEILTPYDQWVSNAGLSTVSMDYVLLSDSLTLQLNNEATGYCDVNARHLSNSNQPPGPNWTGDLPGIEMRCYVKTTRAVNDSELASFSLYGFGCDGALAIQSGLSIPPKPLVGVQPQQEIGEQVEDEEEEQQSGSGLDANGCYEGDAYSVDENLCCAPEDYFNDGYDDSCDAPFYNPYP